MNYSEPLEEEVLTQSPMMRLPPPWRSNIIYLNARRSTLGGSPGQCDYLLVTADGDGILHYSWQPHDVWMSLDQDHRDRLERGFAEYEDRRQISRAVYRHL